MESISAQSQPLTLTGGYQPLSMLYQGHQTLVYQALRLADQIPVVIKTSPKHLALTFSDHLSFRNQFAISHNLQHPGIVRTLSLESIGSTYALIMEDGQGASLSDFLQSPVALLDGLQIAVQLAEILHYLCQQRVLHKDIKPANILIDPDSKQVKLIDFSIASLLPKETQEIKNPNVLEGTLAYMAPEQTGRMNRGIDFRSDFYSLGITLFELFAGHLPFQAEDPMALVHCHIAQSPPSLRALGIPEAVAEIVSKLMSKNAEDRYQSALGLKHDLENCLTQLQEQEQIETFELGSRDICDRFLIPEKLYGREREVQTLLEVFDRVAGKDRSEDNGEDEAEAGSPPHRELLLVAGYSGVGKTAIINEIHKPITRQQGYFIKGKFDQLNRNIPLSAFIQAFQQLVKQLLSESSQELTQWQDKILAAVGSNGQVILEVIPELEQIMGRQPQVPDLSGSVAQNRFNGLLPKFLQVFATAEHPLVIFLDDLQWVDAASLNLLKLLMAHPEMGHLLVIGAYRGNEIFPTHPLVLTLNELRKLGCPCQTLALAPLTPTAINQLVADTLRCQVEFALPLTELIYQKTAGNPFFATQFLKHLYEQELIKFNVDRGHWQSDISQVKSAALTEDVLALMIDRLQQLPTPAQEVLKLAACIGNQFDLDTLATICERSPVDVSADLWQVLQGELILPINDTYKFFQSADPQLFQAQDVSAGYRFLHDRVQQAAYALIPEQQKQLYHLQIGESLLRHLSPIDTDANVAEIAGHFNAAASSLIEPAQRTTVIQLNLLAAEKAKKSTAYAAAVDYLKTGIQLLDHDPWLHQSEVAFQLYNNMLESAFLAGDFTFALANSVIIKQHSRNILGSIKAYEIEIQISQAQHDQIQSLDIALSVLHQLQIEIPEHPTESDFQKEIDELNGALGDRKILDIGHLPPMNNPTVEAAMRILALIVGASYQVRPALFRVVATRQLNLALQHGLTAETPLACALYGMVLVGTLIDVEQGYQFGQLGIELLKRPNADPVKTITQHLFNNHIRSFKDHARLSLGPARENFMTGMEAGDVEYAAYCLTAHFHTAYFAGIDLETLTEELATYRKILEKAKLEISISHCAIPQQAVANLQDSATSLALVGDFYDERAALPQLYDKNDGTALAFIYIYKLGLACLFRDFTKGQECSEEAEKFIGYLSGETIIPAFYFYSCLAQLFRLKTLDADQKQIALDRFQRHLQILKRFAGYSPVNYQHKQDLVEAEFHRFEGCRLEALELYDCAIAGAQANQYLQEEAFANELAAQFYLDWGKEKIAAVYLQEAYSCYSRWGAKAKTDDLEQHYPHLLQPIVQQHQVDPLATLAAVTRSITHGQASQSVNTFDLTAILQSAQILSSNIQLETLLAQLIAIAIQNSGAETGAVILPNPQRQWQVYTLERSHSQDEQTPSLQASQPLEQSQKLPIKLIQQVQHTLTAVVLAQPLSLSDLPVDDPYLIAQLPQSLLCIPLLYQGNLKGILYLENRQTAQVFTPERQAILNFLGAQAAIALSNAQLYESAAMKSAAIEASIEGVAIMEGGQFIYLNQRHQSLFGYDLDDLTDASWEDFFAPTEIAQLRHTASVALKQERQWSGEATAQHQDRTCFPAEVSLYLLDDGKLICICSDISDRKRTTAALELSKARATAAFEQAAVGFAESDMQTGKLIRVNTLFCEMTGYTNAELAAMTIAEITHPEDIAASKQAVQQLYAGQVESFTLEKRYIRKDGTCFWSETTAYLVTLQGGQAIYTLGLIQDISDRKATEKAFSLTRFAVENASTSFFWVNEAGCFLDVNETACQTLGYTSEELQSKRIWDIVPSFPCDAWPEHWQCLKQQSYRQFESYHQAKDGRIFPVEINSNYLEYDGQGFIFAQVQDISNRKQAEKALLFTQYSVDNASDCTFWIKPDGRFVYANRAASSMHGYSIDELMLMSAFDINPNMTPEGWHQHWHSVKQQHSFSLESYHQTKDGRVFPVEVFVNFLEFDGEEYNFVRVRDISNRKAAEAELYQLNFELEQRVQERTHELSDALKTLRATQKSLVEAEKMAALGNLVAGVAHEINTPIGTSITVASTLADETAMFLQAVASGQLKRSVLNRYTNVAQKCSTLINSNLGRAGDLVQSFKQVAVDQTHQELRTFNLKAYLQEVVRSLQPQVSHSGHQLSLTGDNSISLTSDPGVFAQIVTNLVTNSIHHAYPSGESGQLHLRIDQQNNQIMLQYSDDGCGIPASNLSKIYEPFFTTARKQGGTGLGLNIVYNLVTQSLQGTIEIQSQEGQGTTFTIALP